MWHLCTMAIFYHNHATSYYKKKYFICIGFNDLKIIKLLFSKSHSTFFIYISHLLPDLLTRTSYCSEAFLKIKTIKRIFNSNCTKDTSSNPILPKIFKLQNTRRMVTLYVVKKKHNFYSLEIQIQIQ
jgi:hypothetical protein